MIAPVVTWEWLDLTDRARVLVDVRHYLDGRSGLDAYAAAHPPGALFLDLDRWLAAPPTPELGRHPLPSPATFAEGMGSLGIGDGTTVVAYDDAGGVMAARLVWMLRALGQEAALIDGGLASYAGALTSVVPDVSPAVFTARPLPGELLASIEDVSSPGPVVIDARPADRFRGENETLDARAGHIPGARSLPCRENLSGTGCFLEVEELRERFAAVGITADSDVVSYCGSGVTACHNLLAMEYAGLGTGRLFPGSWSAYAATDRPLASGS